MAKIISLRKDSDHRFSKNVYESLTLLKGLGVEGDAHCGKTLKHRSRVKADPNQLNLRQIHLLQMESIEELRQTGFNIAPGVMGENILTQGVDLLALPVGSVLEIGTKAVLKVTGLRNPCAQLDTFQKGLTEAVLVRDEQGRLNRKAGIMAIVMKGGVIRVDDPIISKLPDEPHMNLEPV